MPTFEYTVDDEPQTTTEHTLTPNQILQKAGIDSGAHYFVKVEGHMNWSQLERFLRYWIACITRR